MGEARAAYPTREPNVLAFQPFLQQTPPIALKAGGTAQLTNLNTNVGAWYLLRVDAPGVSGLFNIEKPYTQESRAITLSLDEDGLVLTSGTLEMIKCPIGAGSLLAAANERVSAAAASARRRGPPPPPPSAYSALCSNSDVIFLRTQIPGITATSEEAVANGIRSALDNGFVDRLAGGGTSESVISAGKWFLGWGRRLTESSPEEGTGAVPDAAGETDRPARALLKPQNATTTLSLPGNTGVGIELDGAPANRQVLSGEWYKAKNAPGVYVSAMLPGHISNEILNSYSQGPDRVDPLEPAEMNAPAYLVAFDMAGFTVGWKHGASLPEAAWSAEERSFPLHRGDAMAGPDGFGTFEPLTMAGLVTPSLLSRLVATMCGGFQRKHGVFVYGELSRRNFGSYFGFMENGVLMSSLNPGLATIAVDVDGQLIMKTWTEQDNALLPRLVHARQNGVAIVDGVENGVTKPGRYVGYAHWGDGAWSGLANAGQTRSARAPRAAVCLSEQNGRRYLIYGYFSSANPSQIARVFQSERCAYGYHLDMNSVGQGYMGLFTGAGNQRRTENPISAMSSFNKPMPSLGTVPRYVSESDNADFFYVMRKNP